MNYNEYSKENKVKFVPTPINTWKKRTAALGDNADEHFVCWQKKQNKTKTLLFPFITFNPFGKSRRIKKVNYNLTGNRLHPRFVHLWVGCWHKCQLAMPAKVSSRLKHSNVAVYSVMANMICYQSPHVEMSLVNVCVVLWLVVCIVNFASRRCWNFCRLLLCSMLLFNCFDWVRVMTRVLTFNTRRLEHFLSLYCQQGPSKVCRTTVQKQYHTRDHAVVLNVITPVILSLAQLD